MDMKNCSGTLNSCSTNWSKCLQGMNDSSEPRHERRGSLNDLLLRSMKKHDMDRFL